MLAGERCHRRGEFSRQKNQSTRAKSRQLERMCPVWAPETVSAAMKRAGRIQKIPRHRTDQAGD